MEEMSEETIKKLVGDCFDALEKSTGYDNSVEPTLGSCTVSSTFESLTSVNMMVEDDAGDSGLLGTITQVRVRPAADSGACDHVINPDELPDDAGVARTPLASTSRVPTTV